MAGVAGILGQVNNHIKGDYDALNRSRITVHNLALLVCLDLFLDSQDQHMQELLGVQPKWFEAGAKDDGFPPLALISLEFLLLGFLELKRYQGFKKTGKVTFTSQLP